MADRFEIEQADSSRVDELEPLWAGMVEHHRTVARAQWPVADAATAWHRRRPQYLRWLSDGDGWLILGSRAGTSRPAMGYAFVRLVPSGATWNLGQRIGELESLAVSAEVRHLGLGGRLVEAARELLDSLGVRYWTVAVVEANEGATRLYERHGFRPYYRQLLAPVNGSPVRSGA